MTLAQYFNSQFDLAQTLDFFIRILVACACGAIIGLERTKRFKEAGIRTHVIVACASALFMITSVPSSVRSKSWKGRSLTARSAIWTTGIPVTTLP